MIALVFVTLSIIIAAIVIYLAIRKEGMLTRGNITQCTAPYNPIAFYINNGKFRVFPSQYCRSYPYQINSDILIDSGVFDWQS